jgi:hypothetical protein
MRGGRSGAAALRLGRHHRAPLSGRRRGHGRPPAAWLAGESPTVWREVPTGGLRSRRCSPRHNPSAVPSDPHPGTTPPQYRPTRTPAQPLRNAARPAPRPLIAEPQPPPGTTPP